MAAGGYGAATGGYPPGGWYGTAVGYGAVCTGPCPGTCAEPSDCAVWTETQENVLLWQILIFKVS